MHATVIGFTVRLAAAAAAATLLQCLCRVVLLTDLLNSVSRTLYYCQECGALLWSLRAPCRSSPQLYACGFAPRTLATVVVFVVVVLAYPCFIDGAADWSFSLHHSYHCPTHTNTLIQSLGSSSNGAGHNLLWAR